MFWLVFNASPFKSPLPLPQIHPFILRPPFYVNSTLPIIASWLQSTFSACHFCSLITGWWGKNMLSSRVHLCMCVSTALLKSLGFFSFFFLMTKWKVPMTVNVGMGVSPIFWRTGPNKGRKSIWRMAELLLRKLVEEGIPPFSRFKMDTMPKTYELKQEQAVSPTCSVP